MADINFPPRPTGPQPTRERRREPREPIWDIIELLFFAYRDFVGDPDDVLAKLGFGRAHHRVLHFVNRNPGMKVADLLDILKITKQSLGRVLKQLVDQGYVVQKEGANDRRQRLLFVTPKGEALAMKLAGLQTDAHRARLGRTRARRARGGAPFSHRHDRRRRAATRVLRLIARGRSRAARRTDPCALRMPHDDCRRVLADDAPHLLVVDDDRRIRDLLSRFLLGEGYRVTTARQRAPRRAPSSTG